MVLFPRIGDAIQESHARGSRERTTKAVTALSEALSAELQMPLDLLERGDHERNPWSNFPVSEREREPTATDTNEIWRP